MIWWVMDRNSILYKNVIKNTLSARGEVIRMNSIKAIHHSHGRLYVVYFQETARQWERKGQTGVNRFEPCFQSKGEKLAPGWHITALCTEACVTPAIFKVPSGDILAQHLLFSTWMPRAKSCAHSRLLTGKRNLGSSPRRVCKATPLQPFPLTLSLTLSPLHFLHCSGPFVPTQQKRSIQLEEVCSNKYHGEWRWSFTCSMRL